MPAVMCCMRFVMWVVVQRGLSLKVQLLIYRSINISALSCGQELWIGIERMRLCILADEIRSLGRVSGPSLRLYWLQIRCCRDKNIPPIRLDVGSTFRLQRMPKIKTAALRQKVKRINFGDMQLTSGCGGQSSHAGRCPREELCLMKQVY